MQWLFLASVATTPAPEPIDLAWHFRGRPPIVEVSRESVEPPMIAPTRKESLQVQKSCLCSPLCVCGCQKGEPCKCQTANYSAIPNSSPLIQGAAPSTPVGLVSPTFHPVAAPVFRSMLPSVPMLFGRPSSTAGAACKT